MPITRTPIIDDDGSGHTGTIINNAWKTELYNQIDGLPGVSGAWATYFPSWQGADGLGPVLGNGILSGRYLQTGKWIDVAIVLQMGSTTSFGTSSYWTLSLPFAPKLITNLAQEVTFRGGAVSGAGAALAGFTGYAFGTALYMITGTGAPVNPSTPATWNAGAVLTVRGSYELP
jgi:hypothetical protein